MAGRKHTFAKCILFIISLLTLAIGLWAWWVNLPVRIPITRQTMPSSNAINYYFNADKNIVDAELIQWAISSKPTLKPVQDKSTPTYEDTPDSATIIDPNNLAAPGALAPSTPLTLATLKDKEILLSKNATNIATINEGFKYECRIPITQTQSEQVVFPGNLITVERLIVLQAQVKRAKQDWNGATNCYLDGIKLGIDVARGGKVGHSMASKCLQELARKAIWPIIPHLSSAQALSATHKTEKLLQKTVSYADILTMEKCCEQINLQQFLDTPNWRRELASCYDLLDGQDHTIDMARVWVTSKRTIMSVYANSLDDLISDAHKPYSQRLTALAPTNALFLGFYDLMLMRFDWEYTCAMDRMLAVAFALHAWKVEHGTYPASLKELTPRYLKKLPDDPFASSGTFKYKRTGSNHLLYSLGPDCKDDGGTAIKDSVRTKSKGDLVAGVNL